VDDDSPVDKLTAIAKDCISQGLEGIIAKRPGHLYKKGKRSHDWVKFKNIYSEDLLCTGIVPSTKREGEVGAIEVMYNGETVRVSGITEELKKLFFSKPEAVIGKTVEVKHYGETSNAKLRHPTFVMIREDK
jgi:ATP-dependent DNA ligase